MYNVHIQSILNERFSDNIKKKKQHQTEQPKTVYKAKYAKVL